MYFCTTIIGPEKAVTLIFFASFAIRKACNAKRGKELVEEYLGRTITENGSYNTMIEDDSSITGRVYTTGRLIGNLVLSA